MSSHTTSSYRSPSPVITHHRPRIPSLPTRELLDSIASGAHYAGALQHPDEPPLHARHWRTRSHSRSADDPSVELLYTEVMQDLEQLFSEPTFEIVRRRFREDATLEHPLFTCLGFRDIAAVLLAIPRIFTTKCVSTRILSAGVSPNRLSYIQTRQYTLRLVGFKKVITSVVFVDLDDDMKIVQMVDQWNGEENSTGRVATSLRRLPAKTCSWITRFPEEFKNRR